MLRVRRGDIIYVNLGQHKGSAVASGIRPCFVLSNDKSSWFSKTLCVCPITTKFKNNPVHVKVVPEDVIGFLEKESEILPEQVITIDKRNVMSKVGHFPKDSEVMKKINYAVCLQFGLFEYLQEVMNYAAEKNR